MNTEFEDMRQQLSILKEKLQHQAIVNDQVFRRSMKRNVMSINRRYMFISILCILMIPYAYWAFVVMAGMSFYFWLATAVLLLVSFCYTIYNGRNLNSRLVERDLVDARMKVSVVSFSYPRGVPDDPDDDYWGGFVFDCRSLPDPHDDMSLRG